MRPLGRLYLSVFLAAAGAGIAPDCAGQVSSGGKFSLSLSVSDSGGGEALSGGKFATRGAIGQSFVPDPAAGDTLSGGAFALREGFFSRPRFTVQSMIANTVASPSGTLLLSLPANSVSMEIFDVIFRKDPISDPLRIDPSKILEANRKMLRNKGALAQIPPNHIWEINVMNETGFLDEPVTPRGTIVFRFTDANGDGIVDGTSPPVRVKTLNLWHLDEGLNMWVKVPDSSVDPGNGTVTAPLGHFSVFAFIGGADTSVSDVYPFPVPFRPSGPNAGTGRGQTGTVASGIIFTNLPSEGDIEIYTLAGALVRRLNIPINLGTPLLTWDVRNSAGQSVASGVYIWRVVSKGISKRGRLMVIR